MTPILNLLDKLSAYILTFDLIHLKIKFEKDY